MIEPDGLLMGERAFTTDAGHDLPLAYYGPHGTIRTISAADLLLERVEQGDFSGRVAAEGVTVTGGGDVFATPFDPVLPGVEVIATAISHLVTGDGLVRDGRPAGRRDHRDRAGDVPDRPDRRAAQRRRRFPRGDRRRELATNLVAFSQGSG